jgi:hypothetical protein
MATKKEKRAAALAKREAMLAEVKTQGLEALRKDRERREVRRVADKALIEDIIRHSAGEEMARVKRFAEAFVIGFEEGMTEE